jgi:hypothetical protein
VLTGSCAALTKSRAVLTLRLLARRRLAVLGALRVRRGLCLRGGAGLRTLRAGLCALRAMAGLTMGSRSMLTLRHGPVLALRHGPVLASRH